jgi:hypothetical protein
MSEKLPVFVVVTSADCSACRNLRSSGEFNRDGPPAPNLSFYGHKWDAFFFWKLLSGESKPKDESEAKFRVYELELYHMDKFTHSGVKSFTEFVLTFSHDSVDINRNTFCRDTEKGDAIVYLKDETPLSKGVTKSGSFTKTIANIFPAGLAPLIVQFPIFMWFSKEQWSKAMSEPGYTPYGYAFGLKIGEKDENGASVWRIVARENDAKRENPVAAAENIANNLITLNPPPFAKKVVPEEKTPASAKVSSNGNSNSSENVASATVDTSPPKHQTCSLPVIKVVPLTGVASFYAMKRAV